MSIFRQSDYSKKKTRVKKVKLATQDKTSKKIKGCAIHGSRETVARIVVDGRIRNVCEECKKLYENQDVKHPVIWIRGSSL